MYKHIFYIIIKRIENNEKNVKHIIILAPKPFFHIFIIFYGQLF